MNTEPRRSLLQSESLSREFTSVGVEDTVAQALAKIRQSEGQGDIFYCYACDPEGRLVGVVPVRKLLRAAPEDKIRSLMFGRVVKLPLDAPDELVEDFFVTYRFLAFPVVDAEGRIVGVVEVSHFVDTYSDVLDEDVEGRVRDEVFRFVGLPKDELTERATVKKALRRFPWLLVTIGGGLLAAFQARLFETTLTQLVAVAAFIPMVLVLSESLGVQTAAISAALISEGRFKASILRAEVLATSIAGVLAGLLVAGCGFLYTGNLRFPLSLLLAVGVSTAFAASLGAVLPLAFRRVKVDPHLASAPLVLAISDNLTLLIYFSLAKAIAA